MKKNNSRFFILMAVLFLIAFTGFSVYTATITKGRIGKQDISLWDGSTTKTFTRESSEGYTMTFNKLDWPGVDVHQIWGGGANRTNTAIASAISASSANYSGMWLNPGTWDIDDDLTFTEKTIPILPPGAIFSVDTGKTLTFDCKSIQAGPYQIFSGGGELAFADGTELRLSWFPSLASAIDYIDSNKVILIADRSEAISVGVAVPSNVTIKKQSGCVLTVDTMYTLTLTGKFIAEPEQAFIEYGTISFKNGSEQEIYPDWWSADSAGVQKAFNHLRDDEISTVKFARRSYTMTDAVTLLRNGSATNEQYIIDGNGAKLDWSACVLTSGTLFGLGATNLTNAHDTGFIKVSDLMIQGPEDTNPYSATEEDTSLTGLGLSYALNIKLDNVHVRRCYTGIKTDWTWHLEADRCNFSQNFINAHIYNHSTLANWTSCDFDEGWYGILIHPDADHVVQNQSFHQPRFELLKNAVTLDPGDYAAGEGRFGIRGVSFYMPYVESTTYDSFRFGLAFSAPSFATRGVASERYVLNPSIFMGFWAENYDADTMHMVFSAGTYTTYGGSFTVPFARAGAVNPPPTSDYKFLHNLNDGFGASTVGNEPIGEGWMAFNGATAISLQSGGNFDRLTRESAGSYTVYFHRPYDAGYAYSLVGSCPTGYVSVLSASTNLANIEVYDHAGNKGDRELINIFVRGLSR